jgi:hypothetical protein
MVLGPSSVPEKRFENSQVKASPELFALRFQFQLFHSYKCNPARRGRTPQGLARAHTTTPTTMSMNPTADTREAARSRLIAAFESSHSDMPWDRDMVWTAVTAFFLKSRVKRRGALREIRAKMQERGVKNTVVLRICPLDVQAHPVS